MLALIQFDRKLVRITKEKKTFRSIGVHADGFGCDALFLQDMQRVINVFNGESKVTKTRCLGSCYPRWCLRKRKQFYRICFVQRKIEFKGVSFRPVMF